MKIFTTTFLVMFLGAMVYGQEVQTSDDVSNDPLIEQLSFTLKMGTPSLSFDHSGNASSDLLNLGIAEIGSAYKLNSRFSVGISAMGGLGNCMEGYIDDEGKFVEFEDDDDDDEMEEDDDEEECENELEAIMATVNYTITEDIPLLLQASVGYSLDEQAPAFSMYLGYYRELFSQLSIAGGIRWSEVLINLPEEAKDYNRSGLKAEFGVYWNF